MTMKLKHIFIGLGIIFSISGSIKVIDLIHDYYEQFPDEIIKINTTISLDEDYKYPKKVEVKYYIPIDSPLINEDVVYAFKGSEKEYWDVTILRKTDNGFVVELSEDGEENFLIQDPKEFGFKGYLDPTEINGTFEMTFNTEKGMTSFFSELEGNSEWTKVYLHMLERGEEDESNNEKNR